MSSLRTFLVPSSMSIKRSPIAPSGSRVLQTTSAATVTGSADRGVKNCSLTDRPGVGGSPQWTLTPVSEISNVPQQSDSSVSTSQHPNRAGSRLLVRFSTTASLSCLFALFGRPAVQLAVLQLHLDGFPLDSAAEGEPDLSGLDVLQPDPLVLPFRSVADSRKSGLFHGSLSLEYVSPLIRVAWAEAFATVAHVYSPWQFPPP